MWILCSVSDNKIFSPIICSSKELALRRINDEIDNVLVDLENDGIDYDTHISADGMSYQIVSDDNIWSWKIFHFVMEVAH